MQPVLLEEPHYAPETGAAAIFEEVLDDAAAPGDRRQSDDLRHQIVLGVGVAVGDVALAAFLIVEDKANGDARAVGPIGEWPTATVAFQVTIGLSHHQPRRRQPRSRRASPSSAISSRRMHAC